MILPWFPKQKMDKNGKMRARCKAMDWYVDILAGFCAKKENKAFFDYLQDKHFADRKKTMQSILETMQEMAMQSRR